MRKAQSVSNVTAAPSTAHDVGATRPCSAADLSGGQFHSTIHSPSSYSIPAKSPSVDEFIQLPQVGRVTVKDPLHLVVLAPPDSFVTKECSVQRRDTGSLMTFQPINGQLTQWRETSSSTINNEMISEPFKDDEGQVQYPESMSMTTETLIDGTKKETKVCIINLLLINLLIN